MPELFLASASPRRHAILKEFNIPFTPIPNLLEEEVFDHPTLSITEALQQLCQEKAEASKAGHDGLILTMDTIVVNEDKILGKPSSIENAVQMISSLSNKTHQVYSGFCFYDSRHNRVETGYEMASLTFNELLPGQILHYCNTKEVLDKAGGYGIQDLDKDFIACLKGSYYTVMGCPINSLLALLEENK